MKAALLGLDEYDVLRAGRDRRRDFSSPGAFQIPAFDVEEPAFQPLQPHVGAVAPGDVARIEHRPAGSSEGVRQPGDHGRGFACRHAGGRIDGPILRVGGSDHVVLRVDDEQGRIAPEPDPAAHAGALELLRLLRREEMADLAKESVPIRAHGAIRKSGRLMAARASKLAEQVLVIADLSDLLERRLQLRRIEDPPRVR